MGPDDGRRQMTASGAEPRALMLEAERITRRSYSGTDAVK
jgi:hypothetical protein